MSACNSDECLVNSLVQEIGNGKVSTSRADLLFYSRDQRPRSLLSLRKGERVAVPPVAVVWPESTEDVVGLMKWAGENGVGLVPYGGGSGYVGRSVSERGSVVVDTKRMAEVEWISGDDNLVRAQAGILVFHLEEKLNRCGLTLGKRFSPLNGVTLGGWLASGSSGYGESGYGGIDDLAVSLQIVLPSGLIVETNPAPGSSAGPCWTRFFSGSSGEYGIITAAVLKAHRLSEKEIWRAYSLPNLETGCGVLRRLMRQGLKPSFVRLYDEKDFLKMKMAVGLAGEAKFSSIFAARSGARRGGFFAGLRGVENLRSWLDGKALKLAAARPGVFDKISERLPGRYSGGGFILSVVVEGNTEIAEAEFQRCNRDIQGAGGVDLGETPALFWKNNLPLFPFCMGRAFSENSFMETIETIASWEKIPDICSSVRQAASGRVLMTYYVGNPSSQGAEVDFTFVGRPGNPDECLREYDALVKDIQDVIMRHGGVVKRGFFGRSLLGGDTGGSGWSLSATVKRALDPSLVMKPGSRDGFSQKRAGVVGASLEMGEDEILRALGDLVGSVNSSRSFADLIAYEHDCWARRLYEFGDESEAEGSGGRTRVPVWIVRPGASAEAANVVRLASRCGLRVVAYGGGTSLAGGAGGPFDRPTVLIDTKRMCQILDIDEASSTVNVQAGILGQELETKLAARNLVFGHLPSSFSFSTVGGWLSVRGAGEMIAKYGRVEDMCLALSAILPSGDLVNGGSGPMNPYGRELVHLLTGSEGRLGLITTARLRLAAPFEKTERLAAVFKTSAGALKSWARCFAYDVKPIFARVLQAGESVTSDDVSGYLLLAEFGGPEPVVSAEKSVLSSVVEREGGIIMDSSLAEGMRSLRTRKYYEMIQARVGRRAVADEIDVSAPWSRLAMVGEAMKDSLQKMGARVELEWGNFALEGGCVKCRFFFEDCDDGSFRIAGRPTTRLDLFDHGWLCALDACRRFGGAEICYRGVGRSAFLYRPAPKSGQKRRRGAAQKKSKFILDEPRWELLDLIDGAVDPGGIFGKPLRVGEENVVARDSCSGSLFPKDCSGKTEKAQEREENDR